MVSSIKKCSVCPRKCLKPREATAGSGYCGAGVLPLISRIAPHHWEEPCISGKNGSGAVFFSGCVLGCVFCQNSQISRKPVGKVFDKQQFIDSCKHLEDMGVHNINLVSPTPYIPFLLDAFSTYKPSVPIVYNTGGYERPEMIKALEGIVDIYLPDVKYVSSKLSEKYSNAPDYFENCILSLKEMVRQTQKPVFDNGGIMQRGTIVRHLILPNNVENSLDVIDALEPFGDSILLSLMAQYVPLGNASRFSELTRTITQLEYDRVLDYLYMTELDGFVQELSSATKDYVPDFDLIKK